MIFLLLFLSSISWAQTVHVHKLNPDVDFKATKEIKVHETPESLLESQLKFQEKVFAKGSIKLRVKKLNFEEKEDLLNALENGEKSFLIKYPEFNLEEVKIMQKEMYD